MRAPCCSRLRGSQHLEAGAHAELPRIEDRHRDDAGLFRSLGGHIHHRAELDRDVNGQDLGCPFSCQLLVDLAEQPRAGRGGGGMVFKVGQLLVELLAGDIDAVAKRLSADIDVHRE